MAPWILLFIAIVAVFIVLAVLVLPRLLFVTKYTIRTSADRGIKVVDDEDSSSLVFEPSPEARKYISKYVLSYREGKRVLVCKLVKPLSYIDYDIITFNEKDSVDRVFNARDGVDGEEYTHVVELPYNTDYVSIVINEADGEKFENNFGQHISKKRIALFVAFSAVLITAAAFAVKVCLAYMFAGLFRESFLVLLRSNLITAAIVAVAVVVDAVFTVIAFAARRHKFAETGGEEQKDER